MIFSQPVAYFLETVSPGGATGQKNFLFGNLSLDQDVAANCKAKCNEAGTFGDKGGSCDKKDCYLSEMKLSRK